MMLYIFIKFHESIFHRVDTVSILNSTKGHHSVNNAGGVMVFVFCISSDDALYLYQVSQKKKKKIYKIKLSVIELTQFPFSNLQTVNTLANFLSFCLFIAASLSFGFHTSRHLNE